MATNRRLQVRLATLEAVHQRIERACQQEHAEGAIQQVRQFLTDQGIEQGLHESLAEAFARGLGISIRELKARLHEAARAGVPMPLLGTGVNQAFGEAPRETNMRSLVATDNVP